MRCHTSASIHLPHHHAGYAPGLLSCMTEHTQWSSWFHSHCRQRAYPAGNGCTVDRRCPSTHPPTGRYHSTNLEKLKAMHQRYSSIYSISPQRVHPCLDVQGRSLHPEANLRSEVKLSCSFHGGKLPHVRPCGHVGQC